ncbi:myosin-7-like [Magnolia sinica]|uniref:myosin-7-like n=1 Tax=Magnolia sinica TaxID=86752 RepID=UPI0026592666|nr:myosin-7-like [Magnolia sinica]
MVSALEKKIDETERKYEETHRLSEEMLKQAMVVESKIIQLKTDMQMFLRKALGHGDRGYSKVAGLVKNTFDILVMKEGVSSQLEVILAVQI